MYETPAFWAQDSEHGAHVPTATPPVVAYAQRSERPGKYARRRLRCVLALNRDCPQMLKAPNVKLSSLDVAWEE